MRCGGCGLVYMPNLFAPPKGNERERERELRMAMAQTHYDLLGLSMSASDKEIKRAYRRMALLHHPDKNSSSESSELFKRLVEANDVLSDQSRRRDYDLELQIKGHKQAKRDQQQQQYQRQYQKQEHGHASTTNYETYFKTETRSSNWEKYYDHMHSQPKRRQNDDGQRTGAEFQRSQGYRTSYAFQTGERVDINPGTRFTQAQTTSSSIPVNPIPQTWQKQNLQFKNGPGPGPGPGPASNSGSSSIREQYANIYGFPLNTRMQPQPQPQPPQPTFTFDRSNIPQSSQSWTPPQQPNTRRGAQYARHRPFQRRSPVSRNNVPATASTRYTTSGRPSRTRMEANERVEFVNDYRRGSGQEGLEGLSFDDESDSLVEIDETEFVSSQKENKSPLDPKKKPKAEVKKEVVEEKQRTGITLEEIAAVLNSVGADITSPKVYTKDDLFLDVEKDEETVVCPPPPPLMPKPQTVDELLVFSKQYAHYHESVVNYLQLLRKEQLQRENVIHENYADLILPVNQEILSMALERNHSLSQQLKTLESEMKGTVMAFKECVYAFAKEG